MLKSSTPKTLTEGVTVSPARLMLEVLAIYETFGCLTTGEEPTLISEHGENWWLEASRSTYEEHSVEKQFGSEFYAFHGRMTEETHIIHSVSSYGPSFHSSHSFDQPSC